METDIEFEDEDSYDDFDSYDSEYEDVSGLGEAMDDLRESMEEAFDFDW